MNSNDNMQSAIIGLGTIGMAHLSSLSNSNLISVLACADPDTVRWKYAVAEFPAVKYVADYREVLDRKDVDLVIVGTPHHLHRSVVVDSLEAGKHVIVDKPIASSLAEAQLMLDAAERTGKRLFVAHNHRFLPSNQRMCSLIKSGSIGRPFLGMSCFIGDEFNRVSDPNNWKGSLTCGGGVLLDNGVHMIDILQSFFGRVEWVSAAGWQGIVNNPAKGEDTAMAQLGFKNGIVVDLGVTFVAKYNGFPVDYVGAGIRHDFYGDQGSLHFSSKESIVVCDKDGRHIYEHEDAASNTLLAEDEHFVECILDGKKPVVSANDGVEAIKVVEAAYQSTRDFRRVSLSEINAGLTAQAGVS